MTRRVSTIRKTVILLDKSAIGKLAGSISVGARDFSPDSRSAGHLLPYEWLVVLPWLYRKTKSSLRLDEILLRRSKSSLRSVEICVRSTQTMKPRNLFGFGASFTLAAIYSRGTCRPTTIDVLMFHFRVRNGTGWDHQAMTTRFQGALHCFARCLPR